MHYAFPGAYGPIGTPWWVSLSPACDESPCALIETSLRETCSRRVSTDPTHEESPQVLLGTSLRKPCSVREAATRAAIAPQGAAPRRQGRRLEISWLRIAQMYKFVNTWTYLPKSLLMTPSRNSISRPIILPTRPKPIIKNNLPLSNICLKSL